jgi:hypothetical protein
MDLYQKSKLLKIIGDINRKIIGDINRKIIGDINRKKIDT